MYAHTMLNWRQQVTAKRYFQRFIEDEGLRERVLKLQLVRECMVCRYPARGC